ncbi:dentin sialophosphoprotein [Zerene cesonia]|uniref:dentin sialophosphoprotein n=1 Tax=Zerene cesonia TaxID=33412 RepID=UPI0018E53AC2|nr:dentin sialophosphoprotein [Zerene cesonia]
MKRFKRHKIKREEPETSQARNEEHDLAYYIHDRVELMHQVFSVLKHKELRAMAPECVRHISIDDLQELCTEELLGISSKRLCAILDGAEPPSNTESSSSSPERMETISLDSISSDEEILSETSQKKSKKHKHKHHKTKHKRSPTREGEDPRASRAGLTVLELLELQARARAIRAQLQRAAVPTEAETTNVQTSDDDDEVVIKEEAPEVVEISSEDEKPSVQELDKNLKSNGEKSSENAKTVTKKINDLIITVPQSKPTRKIKLNRTKSVKKGDEVSKTSAVEIAAVPTESKEQQKEKKTKKKQRKKDKSKNKDGSDQDEITLQLSDTEKMDLLEDLDRKSATSEDSESSSSSDDVSSDSSDDGQKSSNNNAKDVKVTKPLNKKEEGHVNPNSMEADIKLDKGVTMVEDMVLNESNKNDEMVVEQSETQDVSVTKDADDSLKKIVNDGTNDDVQKTERNEKMDVDATTEDITENSQSKETPKDVEEGEITEQSRNLSDGEISQESVDVKQSVSNTQEVVCISDDEKKSKKKKKEKKKKSKKSDFRESADQNFYKKPDTTDSVNTDARIIDTDVTDTKADIILIADKEKVTDTNCTDDVFEYLELSDDSSCCEVEGVSVLSKEPTAQEIAALSAKIDEIEREEVITEEEIREYEQLEANKDKDSEQVENISWKDRYLESKKVKNVLNTANILNAMRKKNKELKHKMEQAKKENVETKEAEVPQEVATASGVVEGSIDHYNTLEGSTKFVDPIKDVEERKVSKEMEKDAKQLLKMYKKLLKYNDMNKKKDPNKKKKKKQKKNKDKDKNSN